MSHRSLLAALLLAGAALAPGLAAAQPQAQGRNPYLEVTNRGPERISILQVSPTSSNDWGEDLLGRLQLAAGGGVFVNFPANSECQQDIRVVYANRSFEVRTGVDACAGVPLVVDGSAARPLPR